MEHFMEMGMLCSPPPWSVFLINSLFIIYSYSLSSRAKTPALGQPLSIPGSTILCRVVEQKHLRWTPPQPSCPSTITKMQKQQNKYVFWKANLVRSKSDHGLPLLVTILLNSCVLDLIDVTLADEELLNSSWLSFWAMLSSINEGWSLVKTLRQKFGRDCKAEFWSFWNITWKQLLWWGTQPSGPLCLCFQWIEEYFLSKNSFWTTLLLGQVSSLELRPLCGLAGDF